MRKLFLYFLAVILCFQFIGSSITVSLNTKILYSHGNIIHYPNSSATKGELYLWIQHYMSAGDSETQRINAARDNYGVPIWVDAGNYGGPHLTSALINYFHAHGVKVVNRIWSDGGKVPLNTILHSFDLSGHSRGSVDYQLSIGPEIDAFMIDECDQYNPSYYKAIADYVHSKGKLIFVNPGGPNIQTSYQWADKVSVEYMWWGLIKDGSKQNILAANPQKFIGVSKDYGYHMDSIYDPYIAPKSASDHRPSALPAINLARAVWDSETAWDGGVFSMAATPDADGYLPTWWEQYVAALSKD